MAGPDRIFPEEHHQAKMYLKKPADSATAEDEKCQDIYNGANRLSQSQSTWLHCGQEICNKSQEISVNIHAFVIVASEISYFFLEKINSFVFETRIYFLWKLFIKFSYDKYVFKLPRWLEILIIFTREYRVLTGNLEIYIGADRKWKKLWHPALYQNYNNIY